MHSDVMDMSFVTRSSTPDEAFALKRQAAILARVNVPGVIRLGALTTKGNETTLALVPIDGETLNTKRLDLNHLVAAMTTLALTVSHIHERSVVHCNINADAVIISAKSGKPLLWKFDRAQPSDAADAKARDTRGLFELLEQQLALIPLSHAPRAVKVRSRVEAIIQAGRNVADTDLPTPKALARLLRQAHQQGQANQQANQKGQPATQSRRGAANERLNSLRSSLKLSPNRRKHSAGSRPSIATLGAGSFLATAALLLGAFGIWKVASASSTPLIDPSLPKCPASGGTTATGGTALVADIDGDGCGDNVELGDSTIKVNDETFTVGNPGDSLAIGRWKCTSGQHLALLRPSTGQVYVFDNWPARGETASPRQVETIKGARSIASASAKSCDRIAVTTARGSVIIDPAASTTS